MTETPFRFIDLFSGIGGLRAGADAAGGVCVLSCEKDRFARKTYMANFPEEAEPVHDITGLDADSVPDHDLLLAGFPCQPFSVAGVSKRNALGRAHGFACEAQGTLFFEVARIIEARRPAGVILENVAGLASHDRGRTFDVIRRVLREELGYSLSWAVIDARRWLPQARRRIFICGLRSGTGFSLGDVRLPPEADGPRLASVLHEENGSEAAEPPYTEGPRAEVAAKYTLSDRLWTYLQDYAARHKARGNGFGCTVADRNGISRTLSARYGKDGSEILIGQDGGRNPRRLTPRECARLMGFSDGFRIPVSDAQAYRQFGNAVCPPVARAVTEALLPHLQ